MLFAAFVCWAFVGAAAPSRAQDEPAPADEPQATDQPFVGGLFVSATGADYRDPLHMERLLNELETTPFETIYLQVRAWGDAYYDSALVPRALGVSENFDPLQAALERLKGGDRPRRVVAWFTTFRVGNVNRPVPVTPDHVVQRHPDWLSRNAALETEDAEGNRYLEPGLEAALDHLDAVVRELVSKYEIDGLLLDGVAYPGLEGDWGYHLRMLDRWRDETGETDRPAPTDPEWRELRRETIDKSLRRLVRAARKARPDMPVAATALAEGPPPETLADFRKTPVYFGALQNWPRWMEKKWVDSLVVQNYREEGAHADMFDGWNAFTAALVEETGVEALIGVAGFRNISVDALAQIRRTHKTGLKGIVLADYRRPILDETARSLFFRALGGGLLALDSHRLEFPKEIAALEPTPTPAPEFPPPSVQAEPPEEEEPIEPQPPDAETLPPPPEAAPEPTATPAPAQPEDETLRELTEDAGEADRPLFEPSRDAIAYLKRKFPNIF